MKYLSYIFILVTSFYWHQLKSQNDSMQTTNDQNPNYIKSKNKYTLQKQTATATLTPTVSNSTVQLNNQSQLPNTDLLQKKLLELKNKKEKAIFKKNSMDDLSIQYKKQGDFKKALEIELLLKKVTDSLHFIELNSSEIQQKLKIENIEQQVKNNIEKEKNKAIFRDRILMKESEINKTKLISYYILGLCLMSILLAFFLFRSFRNTKQQKIIIEKSLQEKNILLKEIHHRVKNNLQIITSLLNLQLKGTNNEEAKQIMEEVKNRVSSISLIHQSIYQSNDLSTVNIQKYIEELYQIIHSMFNINKKNITCIIKAESINLNIDTAVPLGLIINELLTNCYKYAFNSKENGEIIISVLKKENNTFELLFNDNGSGFPNNFELKTQKSLGITLVKGLTQQLKGDVKLENKNGAQFSINFKEISV